jgi:transcriptional regulator with PAS, ATPase and Fis domain
MSQGGEKFLRRTLVTDYDNKRLNNFDKKSWDKEINFVADLDLSREFIADDQRLPVPDEETIREILTMIGKEDQMENEIGCESCGYSSCRDFAVAVSQGLATSDMCQIYSTINRQEYIKSLRATNDKLAKTQAALRDSEEKAKHEQEAEKEATETMSAMLNKLVSGVVILDQDLKVIQSNKAFIRILGEEAALVDEVIPGLIGADLKTLLPLHFYKLFSYVLASDDEIQNKDVHIGENTLSVSIFTIRKNKFIGGILRDIYAPEVRKEQIISRLSETIDENFEMVQKIAYLLGEGAATTEKMLKAVIESYQSPPKK